MRRALRKALLKRAIDNDAYGDVDNPQSIYDYDRRYIEDILLNMVEEMTEHRDEWRLCAKLIRCSPGMTPPTDRLDWEEE